MPGLKKKFFSPSIGPHFRLKIRGGVGPPGPSPGDTPFLFLWPVLRLVDDLNEQWGLGLNLTLIRNFSTLFSQRFGSNNSRGIATKASFF